MSPNETPNERAAGAHVAARGVGVRYPTRNGGVEALRGASFEAARGEFVAIAGASGCGKTTLLRFVGGLLAPTEGAIEIGGAPPDAAQARKAIGFVFQDPSLLPWLDVERNVRLALEVNGGGEDADAGDAAARSVDLVGLGEFRNFYPRQLSGGMKQRAALARALAIGPDVLLLDEPLGALDEITRAAMRYEILRLWERSGATAIIVTHSIVEAVAMADRVLVMDGPPGRIAGEVSVDLPRPRETAIERSSEFIGYVDEVQRLLARGAAYGPAA